MKKLLVFSVLLFTAGSLFAEDFVAPQRPRRRTSAPARVRPQTRVEGGFARAAQSGNPLQMVNPSAPREYGSGADLVSDEQEPPTPRPQYKVGRGLRLFSVEF